MTPIQSKLNTEPFHAHSWTVRRIVTAIVRRLRLYFLRLWFPRVNFGSGCDVRSGFRLLLGAHGRLNLAESCVVDREMTIECQGELSIGARTILGHHCTLACRDQVVIGEDCLIAEMVSIRDHDHRFDRLDLTVREQGEVIAPIRIGRNVWLGAKVTVLRGVSIGDNVIVGANSVVTRDLPENAIAVGAPARVIRFRNSGN